MSVNNLILRYRYANKQVGIRALKGLGEGEVVFILATGPSVKDFDLKHLNGKRVILLNAAITLLDKFDPKFAAHLVIDTNRNIELRDVRHSKVSCYIRSFTSPYGLPIRKALFGRLLHDSDIFMKPSLRIQRGKLLAKLDRDNRVGKFSDDMQNGFFDVGNTVALPAIQLAMYMNCASVVLIGVDLSYAEAPGLNYSAYIPGMNVASKKESEDRLPYTIKCFRVYDEILNQRGILLLDAGIGNALYFLRRYKAGDFLQQHATKSV